MNTEKTPKGAEFIGFYSTSVYAEFSSLKFFSTPEVAFMVLSLKTKIASTEGRDSTNSLPRS